MDEWMRDGVAYTYKKKRRRMKQIKELKVHICKGRLKEPTHGADSVVRMM